MSDPVTELREAAARPAPAPGGMTSYLARVRARAYEISDEDVEGLRRAGFTEDEIFEQTVAVAVDEGLRRLDAALRVIGG